MPGYFVCFLESVYLTFFIIGTNTLHLQLEGGEIYFGSPVTLWGELAPRQKQMARQNNWGAGKQLTSWQSGGWERSDKLGREIFPSKSFPQ